MRVQVVQHHRDPLCCRVVPIGEFPHRHSPIGARAPLSNLDLAPAGEWLGKQKQISHAVPFLFVILALWLTRGDGQSPTGFAHELFAGLIPTDHRTGWVQRTLVDLQHVFHRGHKPGAVRGRNRPVFFYVRLQFIFFRVRRIVS